VTPTVLEENRNVQLAASNILKEGTLILVGRWGGGQGRGE